MIDTKQSSGQPPFSSTQPPTAALTPEQRVSVLVGDRLCTRCGYNLTGQVVLREPHYQMLIVRCPECATVASVQEYPLLGVWANRWATLLAALWMLLLMGLWIGSGAAIFGFSIGIAESSAWQYGSFLSQQYDQWRLQAAVQNPAASGAMPPVLTNDWQTWWNAQDQSALFAETGGWGAIVNWTTFAIGVPFAVVTFVFGCIWATALLARGWRGRLAAGMLIMLVACFFSFISYLEWHSSNSSWWSMSRQYVGPPVLLVSLMLGAAALGLGLLIGRSVARKLLCVLLPPRLCNSLALLWTVDGLPPPKTVNPGHR